MKNRLVFTRRYSKTSFCNTTLAVVVFFFNENITKNPRVVVLEPGTGCANARSDIPCPAAKIVINDGVVLCHLW